MVTLHQQTDTNSDLKTIH